MEINGISFSYDKKSSLLQSVSCEIETGKITTIIGPNGSGKSTLLSFMSNNVIPQSGQVVLDGKAIQQYKPKQFAKKLAVVHQQNEAPYDITVEKLVRFGRLPHKNFLANDTEEDENAIQWALSCTNLESKRTKPLEQSSGGERQRVWIAMALAQRTQLLLLDEPTTFLDLYYQLDILELVKKLQAEFGLTIVMVLHDINQAIAYSHRIIVMKNGEIVLSGEPQEIISAEFIKRIYGVDVAVKNDPELGLYVVPIGV